MHGSSNKSLAGEFAIAPPFLGSSQRLLNRDHHGVYYKVSRSISSSTLSSSLPYIDGPALSTCIDKQWRRVLPSVSQMIRLRYTRNFPASSPKCGAIINAGHGECGRDNYSPATPRG